MPPVMADAEWRQELPPQVAVAKLLWQRNAGEPTQPGPTGQPREVEPKQPNPRCLRRSTRPTTLPSGRKAAMPCASYHEATSPRCILPSCGRHVLKPQLKRVLNELEGEAQGIDIEAEQAIAEQAGVNGTPTVQPFHQGTQQQWRISNAVSSGSDRTTGRKA